MLILSRKKDQTIEIKTPDMERAIRITVVEIDNKNRVKIGIDADREVQIWRTEIKDRIKD